MMLTQKDAKTMAKSLRDSLGSRNVVLTHSECLEIVARQFGSADWNTLAVKLPSEEERHARIHGRETLPATAIPTDGPSSNKESAYADPAVSVASMKNDEASRSVKEPLPWSTCSFCGKSPPEVRIVLGGCGGWEGFRARRNPESGERCYAFICNACIVLCARIAPQLPAATEIDS